MEFNHTAEASRRSKEKLLHLYNNILESGVFLEGKYVHRLEKYLSTLFGGGHIVTLGSGHDALVLSLQALQLPPKSEVLFAVSAYPTAFAIACADLTPQAVDVDATNQIDLSDLENKINTQTKVIIVTHLYGVSTSLTSVKNIAKRYNLWLIEDCAQAFGSTWNNQLLGTFGDIGCFSFYPTKNIGTVGDGGFIWTENKDFAQHIKMSKMYGEKARYLSQFVSGHSRMPELQAATAYHYVKKMRTWKRKRLQVAQWYLQALKNNTSDAFIEPLGYNDQVSPFLHLFVVKARDRAELQKFLTKRHIPTLIHYPFLTTQVTAFSNYSFSKNRFPSAEKMVHLLLSLPFHQYLSKQEVEYVVSSIAEFYHYRK